VLPDLIAKRIESTAGEQEQPEGQGAHASPESEKERKQLHSNWRFALHQMSIFSLQRISFPALAAKSFRSHSAFRIFILPLLGLR